MLFRSLVLVKEQIKMLAAEQRNEVAAGTQAQVAQLARVHGVGLGSAWVLVKELLLACLRLATCSFPRPWSWNSNGCCGM